DTGQLFPADRTLAFRTRSIAVWSRERSAAARQVAVSRLGTGRRIEQEAGDDVALFSSDTEPALSQADAGGIARKLCIAEVRPSDPNHQAAGWEVGLDL